MKDALTGKIPRLPSCPAHIKPLSELHTIYKKFADLTVKFSQKLSTVMNDQKMPLLRMLREAIQNEMNGRLKQASSIKEQYRDEGHLAYMKHLMNNLVEVQNTIKSLNSLSASPSSGTTANSSPAA